MSLSTLSTELDLNILQYLHSLELSQMTGVSRYYQAISEPLLYKSIRIASFHHDRIKKLLFTLLRRKDLRAAILHFALIYGNIFPNSNLPVARRASPPPSAEIPFRPGGQHIVNTLWSNVSVLQDTIEQLLVSRDVPPEFKMAWLSKLLEPHPFFDGAVALILCLAADLQSVNLVITSEHRLPMTQTVLSQTDWNPLGSGSAAQPFRSLHSVSFSVLEADTRGYPRGFELLVPPGVKRLRLTNSDMPSTIMLPAIPSIGPPGPVALTLLRLNDVSLNPRVLEDALNSHRLINLEALEVVGIGHKDWPIDQPVPWWEYDYSHLQDALKLHTPKLRIFKWHDMEHPSDGDLIPFGSFSGFRALKSLMIDTELLFPIDSFKFRKVRTRLPSGLSHLGLCGLDWQAIEDHLINEDMSEDRNQLVTDEFAQKIYSTFPVPRITLGFYMGDIPLTGSSLQHQELNTAQRLLLNNVSALVEKLAAMGRYVSANYYTHQYDRHSNPLVRPGWTTKRLYCIKAPDVEEEDDFEQANSMPESKGDADAVEEAME
jgi:hypothetical protein